MNERNNIRIYLIRCGYILCGCFFVLMAWIIWLQCLEADSLAKNSLNQRGTLIAEDVQRGAILDRNNEKLAYSERPRERNYPYGAAAAAVTGYLGERIGSDGIEGYFNRDLTGSPEAFSRFGPIAQLFSSDKGNNVKLTVDVRAQQAAYSALSSRKGAAVMMDAGTGEILAMVSTPAVSPDSVENNWEELSKQQEGPLLNRALQGQYPPGSTIKVVMTDQILKEHIVGLNETFDCNGTLRIGDYTMHEAHGAAHGKVNLQDALVHSCNIVFGTLAVRLGGDKLEDAFTRFGFDKDLDDELKFSAPGLPKLKKLSDGELAQIGIGQGELLVTPMQMCMAASAVANQGVVMKPHLLDEIVSPSGVVIKKNHSEKWFEAMTAERASVIDSFMEKVVMEGTGTAAQIKGVRVTGKTGTAETSQGEHAWFIGSADINGRRVVLAVIVENGGGGGAVAAPIARSMFLSLLNK